MHGISAARGVETNALLMSSPVTATSIMSGRVVAVTVVMPAIDVSRRGDVVSGIRDDMRRAMAAVSDHRRRNDNVPRSDNDTRAVMMMIMPQRNAEADPRTRLR